ncbi:hypothetical protein Snoj_49580 [Streptomyces nojiriensis]|uniref:Uncharacterized protein n=1 Tax=Streptomyces nojiriensis TaxID=66374 RepID=A0ABQ3STD3_9ACTN|nr:hypothetical protein GCM10010205_37350 [Streptomyces nojiriensis]GHI71040.1 hypothetical protein Snoj_49580 [Streptomyces nojiriensis]
MTVGFRGPHVNGGPVLGPEIARKGRKWGRGSTEARTGAGAETVIGGGGWRRWSEPAGAGAEPAGGNTDSVEGDPKR